MGKPAARVTDMHTCPMVNGTVPHVGGPILPPGAVTVLTGSLPQARIGDMATCVGPPDVIAMGSATVIVCGQPAARMGDQTAHGGVIVVGLPTVLIGDESGAGGGGGGGPGRGGGTGKGGTTTTSHGQGTPMDIPLAAEGNDSLADAMAAAMKEAAANGTPFCEQCTRAALIAKGYH